VIVAVMRPNETKIAAATGKKACPQCAEFVQPDAKICRFCQYKFHDEKPPEPVHPLTEADRMKEAEQLGALGKTACEELNSSATNEEEVCR
jgi:hypothetical protein